MPAPARISVPVKQPTPLKPTADSIPKTPSSISRSKGRVVHRRRARGRLGDTESDDELVREPHSDSDSASAESTFESESISESELENEAKPEARVPSPSQIPLVAAASASTPPPHPPPNPTFFPPSHDWSDMVADENANGVAALPVIDFADISAHVESTSSPPSHAVPPPPLSVQEQSQASQAGTGESSSSTTMRKPHQSARQAYLTRLDSDPAYVPTLGQFWSHDDRLLDKELRSLSGWWRGRWQGRGRGARGRGGFPMRGRLDFGTGGWGMRQRGVFGNSSSHPEGVPEEEIPPADRSWTHDGFEEMKKDEEAQRQPFPFRGKSAFSRGRGNHRTKFSSRASSFAPQNRSSSPQDAQPPSPQPEPPQSSTSDILRFGNGTRPWFAMKPERVWTKQFDGYLYFEAQLKPIPNQGIGQGVRIKLPGMKGVNNAVEDLNNNAVVVRLPQFNSTLPFTIPSSSQETFMDRVITVKLPSNKVLSNEHEPQAPEDVITVAPPPMDDPVVPSGLEPTLSYRAHQADDVPQPSPLVLHPPSHSSDVVTGPQPSGSTSTLLNLPVEAISPQEMAFKEPSVEYDVTSAGPSDLHGVIRQQRLANPGIVSPPPPRPTVQPVLQAMAPPFQPTPSYGSPYPPYSASGLSLPPGIAISEDGVTYEIATGRTVYLHTPPPPPPLPMQVPMYNPRPMPIHHSHHGSVHFLPHHAHGHTSSMSMSVSPPMFLSSPPIFALPRQSSRIEIRAPGGEKGKEKEDTEHLNVQGHQGRSRLTANINAEPFTPASHTQSHSMGYYSAEAQQQAFDNAQRHHQHQQSLYQSHPYYYPVNADGSTPYGYGQQYAGVDTGQPQYDTYGQEPYPQEHAVYY